MSAGFLRARACAIGQNCSKYSHTIVESKVIGFDVFGSFKELPLQPGEQGNASRHDSIAERTGKEEISEVVKLASVAHRIELVDGYRSDRSSLCTKTLWISHLPLASRSGHL